jgi:hypothetical protein
MSFYSDQANQFLQLKAAIQTRLTNEGNTLDQRTYSSLAAKRDALGIQADLMITADIQATLAQLKLDQPRMAACTTNLNNAVKAIKKFDQTLAIVSAALTLATAISSANLGAIGEAVVGAEQAVAAALPKSAVPATAAGLGQGLAIAAESDNTE